MKTTQYFEAMRVRTDRAIIQDEWIERVIDHPVVEKIQKDGRIRRWAPIAEMGLQVFARNPSSRRTNCSQRFL